jgi:hypothetical protein
MVEAIRTTGSGRDRDAKKGVFGFKYAPRSYADYVDSLQRTCYISACFCQFTECDRFLKIQPLLDRAITTIWRAAVKAAPHVIFGSLR